MLQVFELVLVLKFFHLEYRLVLFGTSFDGLLGWGARQHGFHCQRSHGMSQVIGFFLVLKLFHLEYRIVLFGASFDFLLGWGPLQHDFVVCEAMVCR